MMKTEDEMMWAAFWIIFLCMLFTTNTIIFVFEIIVLVGLAVGFMFMKRTDGDD